LFFSFWIVCGSLLLRDKPAISDEPRSAALSLANKESREEYGLKYGCLTGAMANGAASWGFLKNGDYG
jgi:hypothetical protein